MPSHSPYIIIISTPRENSGSNYPVDHTRKSPQPCNLAISVSPSILIELYKIINSEGIVVVLFMEIITMIKPNGQKILEGTSRDGALHGP
jgi:hypothetical protein